MKIRSYLSLMIWLWLLLNATASFLGKEHARASQPCLIALQLPVDEPQTHARLPLHPLCDSSQLGKSRSLFASFRFVCLSRLAQGRLTL
jgi:hypothetical protein